MEGASHILESVKNASIELLSKQLRHALEEAHIKIVNQTNMIQREGSVFRQKSAIMQRFAQSLANDFDRLISAPCPEEPTPGPDYSTLAPVEEDDLEAMIALEGMVSHARSRGIRGYLRFTTRMGAMLYGVRVDESNNPLDPKQLGESFKEAIRSVGLQSRARLIAYRAFNQQVFYNLEQIFTEANRILVEHGVLPELDLSARQCEASTAEVRARSDPRQATATIAAHSRQMLSMLQSLMHGGTAVQPAGPAVGGAEKSGLFQQELGQALLQTSDEPKVAAIAAQSSDVIQLVTMLFDAIWQDRSLPIPVKDLLGRTRIAVLKTALSDAGFFNNPEHPARLLLNELAAVGISWADYEKLNDDPMYAALQRTVEAFVDLDSADIEAQQLLLDDYRGQKSELRAAARAAEARLRDSEERKKRLDEVNDYARSQIQARILDPGVPQSIRDFLDTHFRRFVVEVLLREGPGGESWKPIMNTIDVLLWTVQSNPDLRDRQRFVRVNPRLLANLAKALSVAGLSEEEASGALSEVKRIQKVIMSQAGEMRAASSDIQAAADGAARESARPADLPADDLHLREVSSYPLGIWLEFPGGSDDQSVRGTLADKIESIDKYVFVNAQGVKVIEKSRMELARELKSDSVRVISEAPLLERAMATIIGQLRSQNAVESGYGAVAESQRSVAVKEPAQ